MKDWYKMGILIMLFLPLCPLAYYSGCALRTFCKANVIPVDGCIAIIFCATLIFAMLLLFFGALLMPNPLNNRVNIV